MNDKQQERIYNKYIKGKITLKQLLEWNDKYKEERGAKNVA